MRTVQFANGEFFHIYNRGVDKRIIFQDSSDYLRFLRSVKEFNDNNHTYSYSTLSSPRKITTIDSDPLVRVVAYCLMPNHFHLLLEQLCDNGITNFLHRLGTGYTNYFNLKNKRIGRLFQGSYRAIRVDSTDYLLHLSRYIHLNPLDLVFPDWKLSHKLDQSSVQGLLDMYPWSSYHSYMNPENTEGALVSSSTVLSCFRDRKDYDDFVKSWTFDQLEKIQPFVEKSE